ncbi:hypothetical protein PFBG_00141 [Plasmodium falciparum 7G8]|uniref:Plasmodium falciparum erythrocyte membrane protein 1 acidic terminal segment domain-containing protein n=1 Tax=Plasmodium falciparum (isolate 7G8) TaxID=57266 RepID=W7F8L3_PLAF8|nr:hypothetical protein PFBG_00141 [Plasmodium falciparum 7G8]
MENKTYLNLLYNNKIIEIQIVSNSFRIYWKYLKEIMIFRKLNHRIDIFRTVRVQNVVLLEPTKRDTFYIPSGDTHTNKFTDDDSNQLKQDFIYQYLQNIQKDLPSEKYH